MVDAPIDHAKLDVGTVDAHQRAIELAQVRQLALTQDRYQFLNDTDEFRGDGPWFDLTLHRDATAEVACAEIGQWQPTTVE